MKKNLITSLLVSLVMLIGCFAIPLSASAADDKTTSTVEYLDDGSYIVTTLTLPDGLTRSSKSASKTATAYDANNNALWAYTVTATFTYDGKTSKCTSVSDSYSIYDNNWYMASHSCTKDGNLASGTATAKKKVLGVVVDTMTKPVRISCNQYGNIV
ncbi:MAG: hypothetical protein J6B75_02565 [Ruminococcus sp.]|nr:hypothetical protein [Ruminococcus sp.]